MLRFWCDRGRRRLPGRRRPRAGQGRGPAGLARRSALRRCHRGRPEPDEAPRCSTTPAPGPMWDQDGVHEIYRSLAQGPGRLRRPPDRILCAEAWVKPEERLARYVRRDEMHQAFNFDFLEAPWRRRPTARRSSSPRCAPTTRSARPTTWVLSNHDVVRHASRLGLDQERPRPNGIAAEDPQPDAALGLRRARAATALMLALPGGAYVYQGEELGLPEHTTMPDEVRQDPTFHRTEGAVDRPGRLPGADAVGQGRTRASASARATTRGCRSPRPTPTSPSTSRTASTARRSSCTAPCCGCGASSGSAAARSTWDALTGGDVVAFRTGRPRAATVLVVTNAGATPVALPAGEVLVASGPLPARRRAAGGHDGLAAPDGVLTVRARRLPVPRGADPARRWPTGAGAQARRERRPREHPRRLRRGPWRWATDYLETDVHATARRAGRRVPRRRARPRHRRAGAIAALPWAVVAEARIGGSRARAAARRPPRGLPGHPGQHRRQGRLGPRPDPRGAAGARRPRPRLPRLVLAPPGAGHPPRARTPGGDRGRPGRHGRAPVLPGPALPAAAHAGAGAPDPRRAPRRRGAP